MRIKASVIRYKGINGPALQPTLSVVRHAILKLIARTLGNKLLVFDLYQS